MAETPLTIRRLEPADAPALARCFERCYGRSYVAAEIYDAEATAARIAGGNLRSMIAIDGAGEIVGHVGLTIRDSRARTVDAGNSVVDPRHRGRQLLVELAAGVVALCREGGFLGFHHYPTTAHPIMQRFAVASGGVETGIMLDYVPAGTEYVAFDDAPRARRTAVTVVYQALAPSPERIVYLPSATAGVLRGLYERARIPRRFGPTATRLPARPSRLEMRVDARRGCARLAVAEIGLDLRHRIRSALAATTAALWQIDLPLSDPALAPAVRVAGDLGFFFCALLPEYLESDVLRLQRVAAATVAPSDLATDEACALLDVIEADRRALPVALAGPSC